VSEELRDAAIAKLRGIAHDSDGELSIPKAIRHAFQTAAMLRDEGMSIEVETAIEVLLEETPKCSSAPPAFGYLQGRAQAMRDEAANAPNPNELEDKATILEKAAAILGEG
jgi:hypothetical protein